MIGAPVHWPRPSRLGAPLELPAGKMADGMEALGLRTVGQLLEHLPKDSREARTVAALRAGEQATVAVQVRTIGARAVRRRGMRPLVEARVFDATGSMRATFFNQPWLVQRYPPGTRLLLHGKVDGRGGFRVSHHAVGSDLALAGPGSSGGEDGPGFDGPGGPDRPGPGGPDGVAPLGGAGEAGAVAHYPAAEGVSSTQILTLVRNARGALSHVTEALSAAMRVAEGLPDRASALAAMHFPRTAEDPETGRERLAFEELLLMQLVFLRRRARRRARRGARVLAEEPSLSERWLKGGLPFALTGDQRKAIEAIREDLEESRAMQRLLMGEVGSGKTVVALYAMLRAVEHGHQAALMAPTETLAEQHFATIQRLIGAEPVAGALLTGSTPARRREDILGKLSSGELSLIVGTHALIEPDVRFRALAVAVVDEQHRFGVRQRAALDEKGAPHMLHMTATPIRARSPWRGTGTSTRAPCASCRLEDRRSTRAWWRGRARANARMTSCASSCEPGRQAYVVCPLIDEPGTFLPDEGSPSAGGAGNRGARRRRDGSRGPLSKGADVQRRPSCGVCGTGSCRGMSWCCCTAGCARARSRRRWRRSRRGRPTCWWRRR